MDAFFYILAVLPQVFLAMVRIFCNVDCGASWEGLRMQKSAGLNILAIADMFLHQS